MSCSRGFTKKRKKTKDVCGHPRKEETKEEEEKKGGIIIIIIMGVVGGLE